MSNKVALVTGGSRGVGKGIARALCTAGWTVYITGRSADTLEASAADISSTGQAIAVVCDHSVDADIEAVFARISADAGRLDLLVNNAWSNPKGFIGFNGKYWERPVSDWDALIGVGLRAHYVACVEAAKIMVPQGSGLMCNVSSFGSRGYLHTVLYGMSKSGLDKMAFDMAKDLKGTGVVPVSLWLGLIRTELLMSLGIDEFEGFPLDRAEDPEFVGRVIDALSADDALTDMAGHTIVTSEYGEAHGIVNNDGAQPMSHRDAFGGGPLFPPHIEEGTTPRH